MTEHPQTTDSFSDFTVFEQRLPPFSFRAAFSVGWRTLKRNYWVLVATSVAFMAISSVLAILAGIHEGAFGGSNQFFYIGGERVTVDLASVVQYVSYVFLTPMVSAGFHYVGLLAVRWQSPGVGKLFTGFTRYWLLVRTCLLELVFWSGPIALTVLGALAGYLIGLGLQTSPDDPAIGALVGAMVAGLPALVLMVWLYARLQFSYLLVLDPMSSVSSAREAVRASWNMTRPFAWRLAAVGVSVSVLANLSFLLCCFPGFFLGMPLSCVVVPASYEMIRSAASREPSPGGESE